MGTRMDWKVIWVGLGGTGTWVMGALATALLQETGLSGAEVVLCHQCHQYVVLLALRIHRDGFFQLSSGPIPYRASRRHSSCLFRLELSFKSRLFQSTSGS